MMRFCTLFDRHFLHRGLALYASCREHCGDDFRLSILCLDNETLLMLRALALPHTTLLTIHDLGDSEISALRDTRSRASFAWGVKPSLFLYLMRTLGDGEGLTYLDSDMFFFSNPRKLYDSLADVSIAITPHQFSPPNPKKEYEVGVYNAGWIYLRKDAVSRTTLERWRTQCIARCPDRYENGAFGDQRYLNEWPECSGARVLADRGVNIGPWNLSGKRLYKENGTLLIEGRPLICYHFHALKMYFNRKGTLTGYPVSMRNPLLYRPYVAALNAAVERIHAADPSFTVATDPKPGALRLLKQEFFRLIHA